MLAPHTAIVLAIGAPAWPPFVNELELQDEIERRLVAHGFQFRREARLDARSRPDFLVGRVAIEAKVGGRPAEIERQLDRYARHDGVDAVVLVTSLLAHVGVSKTFNEKPVGVVWAGGAL